MAGDPTELSRRVADAVDALHACLIEDVEIDPVQVLAPLMMSAGQLRFVMDELARAAISVDEQAAASLQEAGERFLQAKDHLAMALVALNRGPGGEPPRGRVYGRPPGPPRSS